VARPSGSAARFSALSPSIFDRDNRLRVARQILTVLEAHLETRDLRDRRVLDVGCSSGIITSVLADFTGPVIGIDVDADALRIARRDARRPGLEFQHMSASALDFPSASFDIVICNQVYYWFEDAAAVMSEIARVLKPGGVCFFAGVNKYSVWEAQYRLPFLALLPRRIGNAYVRATGRADRYECHYLSFWELTRVCGPFNIHRYTTRVLRDPVAFEFVRLKKWQRLTRAVPVAWLNFLERFSPNFVWMLEKPRPAAPPGAHLPK